MIDLNMRRISWRDGNAAEQLAALQYQLSAHGEVVSPRGRALTKAVFGEELTPAQVVERVCRDVKQRGLDALLHYTEQFDGAKLNTDSVRVNDDELIDAHRCIDDDLLKTVRQVRRNVMQFQLGVLHSDAVFRIPGSHELRLRYRPIRRVGICIPGGAAAYPSTLLMTVVPARAAGVKEIVVVMPPTKNGAYNSDLLAVCRELRVDEVYRVGGAQAVAALAYGVDGIPPVDMIVGPGNIFVTLAKKHVFGDASIDCLAGPSEIVVLADDTASPEFIASDLIAQAEHDPGSSILITWHEQLIDAVVDAMHEQLQTLERGELAANSLQQFGALVLARNAEQAVAWANQLGPEHLHIATADPDSLEKRIDNAGAIFLGHYSPVAVGDYAAGPSHVLPTGGTSRFASGLSANDFLRRSSVIACTPAGIRKMSGDICLLAKTEGLTGHAASVEIRLAHTVAAPVNGEAAKEAEVNP